MKRYVIEFANDQIHKKTPKRNSAIKNILDDYKEGFLTPFEAVYLIVEECKKPENYEL